jgi:hypothetical protein
MPVKQSTTSDEPNSHQKLLDRIARRYEQLDEQLEQLEAKLRESSIGSEHPSSPVPGRPRQPR